MRSCMIQPGAEPFAILVSELTRFQRGDSTFDLKYLAARRLVTVVPKKRVQFFPG